MLTDMHVDHIKEHATCLDSPEARSNPVIAQKVTEHIQKHFDTLKNADPQLLMVLGQQPLPPPPPPPAGGPPVPPPNGPHGGPPGPNIPAVQNPTPPVQQEAASIHPSKMPELPRGTPEEAKAAYETIKGNVA